MKIFIIVLSIITFLGCNSQDEDGERAIPYYRASHILFSVYNSENKDLLNPGNSNYLSGIGVFYLSDNGEVKRQPDSFRFKKYENNYRIDIELNKSQNQERPVTYVRWNSNSTDTIEINHSSKNYLSNYDTIWFNGKVLWKISDNIDENGFYDETTPYFNLIK